jgi:hypothetical protein
MAPLDSAGQRDASPLQISGVSGGEGSGALRLTVSLGAASAGLDIVAYETEDETATAGLDYESAQGTLSFADDRSGQRVIEVVVRDDAVDENDETFKVRLTDSRGTVLATVTATIVDDDQRGVAVTPAVLTLDQSRTATYTVALTSEPTATVVVQAAVTPAAYSVSPERLTFDIATWAIAQSVTVTGSADAPTDGTPTVYHTVSGGDYDGMSVAPITGSVSGTSTSTTPTTQATPTAPAPTLTSLVVTANGATMHPEFAPDVYHYRIRCDDPSTLSAAATTSRGGVRMTLLRNDPAQNQVSMTGTLDVAAVDVSDNDDLAIELRDAHGTTTYVVHCVPMDFPQITVRTRTSMAAGGLLFATPGDAYMVILDYNGVPRFLRSSSGRRFRPHLNGPLIDGKQVHYSVTDRGKATLMDKDFETIREATPGTSIVAREFLITENGNFIFVSYEKTTRNGTEHEDSVIREVAPDGMQVFTWNSWDYLKLDPDCDRDITVGEGGDYAHLNSLQLVDGDLVASFHGCGQVVRINWSSETDKGKLMWRLGGTEPDNLDPDTPIYMAANGDNEFCGQHAATLTRRGGREFVLMYDNGADCVGPRKGVSPFTRMVEYDITSKSGATVANEYEYPNGRHTARQGDVSRLDNGNWLIAWGRAGSDGIMPTISEVNPETDVTEFELVLRDGGATTVSHRVYHEFEANIAIPLNLP